MFILLLLVTTGFALATLLQFRASQWAGRSQGQGMLQVLLGDSRRMFANHFSVKADISFHSGYYPSIFDQARQAEEKENHVAHEGEEDEHDEHANEAKGGFMGEPTDWIDRFGRRFRVTEHTHLQGDNIKEILPWLRISAELDPHRIDTYTVAAFFLRKTLGKVDEAEQFLRDGLRANPDSYEILFELGRLYYENRHDLARARGVFNLALRRWQEREQNLEEPNYPARSKIAGSLARIAEDEGNRVEAIKWLEEVKAHSPTPDAVQKQIDALGAKDSAVQPRP
jgi:tetratricopeptide (TPR) repeat protein